MGKYRRRAAAAVVCAAVLFSGATFADMQEGDRSSSVLKLQERLIALNYLAEDTQTTKSFGPLTKRGVKAFQERNGLKATGVVDAKTEKALYASKAKKAKKPVEAPKAETPEMNETLPAESLETPSTQTDAAQAATPVMPQIPAVQDVLLTNDPAVLNANPSLQNDPNVLRNNPDLSADIAAWQAANAYAASVASSNALTSSGNASANSNNSNSTNSISSTNPIPYVPPISTATGGLEAAIQFGMALRGAPYKSGGRGPDAFDCSGFICYILGQYGYKKPGSSQDISDYAAWPTISDRSQLLRGDIVLFHTSGRSKTVGHAGIYLGDGTFLHAEPDSGVTITTLFGYEKDGDLAYYHENYLWAKRPVK